MEFHDVIRSRRSIRAYKPDAVEEDKLDRILEAGRLAPTAANRQAFEILVIRGEAREKLRRAYGREWLTDAPLTLLVCARPQTAWARSDAINYAIVDAAIVMDHMILAAEAEGLGTCWIGAFTPQALREDLALPEELEPVAMTPVGYAAESPDARPRKPLEELVRVIIE